MKRIGNQEELRALLGKPHPLTEKKIYDHLFPAAREFLGLSPLVFMATADAAGNATVSPKGDAPGFVKVLDDRTLLIPERPGNKLLHGLSNILETGKVGLIFIIPGTEETLRINGECGLYTDKQLCEELAANRKPALLLMRVEVRQCFFHCAKAFRRNGVWDPDTWPEPVRVSFGKQIAGNAGLGGIAEVALSKIVDQAVKSDIKKNL